MTIAVQWDVKPQTKTTTTKTLRYYYLHPYIVYASREGSGESAHMCRLPRAFATCGCNKYWNLVHWTSPYKLVLIFFHPDSMTLSDQNVTTSPSGDSKKKNSVGTPAGQDMKRRRHKKKKPKKRKKNGRNGKTGTKINGNPDKSKLIYIARFHYLLLLPL